MNRFHRRALSLAMVVSSLLLVVALAPQTVSADGAWLYGPPTQWNTPGMAIPQAPPRDPAVDSRCFDALVVPDTAARRALVEAGWFLFNSPSGPAPTSGVEIVFGQSNADGMCRPTQYQAFVFVDGVFAGTLSPVLMYSRTDGALYGASLREGNQIWADYAWYKDTDPLCCPYGRTTAFFEITRAPDAPVVRLLSAASLLNDNTPTVVVVPRPTRAPVQAPRSN